MSNFRSTDLGSRQEKMTQKAFQNTAVVRRFVLAPASWCARTGAGDPILPCPTSPACPDTRTNWRALGKKSD